MILHVIVEWSTRTWWWSRFSFCTGRTVQSEFRRAPCSDPRSCMRSEVFQGLCDWCVLIRDFYWTVLGGAENGCPLHWKSRAVLDETSISTILARHQLRQVGLPFLAHCVELWGAFLRAFCLNCPCYRQQIRSLTSSHGLGSSRWPREYLIRSNFKVNTISLVKYLCLGRSRRLGIFRNESNSFGTTPSLFKCGKLRVVKFWH